jgi:hypothetical protein
VGAGNPVTTVDLVLSLRLGRGKFGIWLRGCHALRGCIRAAPAVARCSSGPGERCRLVRAGQCPNVPRMYSAASAGVCAGMRFAFVVS